MATEVIMDRTKICAEAPSLARRVSWGAIFAGLFVTIVIQLLFTLLGLAVGMMSLESMRNQSSGHKLAMGAGIWLRVLDCADQFRQRVLGITVKHPGHRLEE